VSHDQPLGPPPSDPPGQPEYLDSHEGAPLPHQSARPGRRTAVVAVVAGVGAVAVGGAAWAAWSFFSTGAQPAEALPASTIAYASIDLDPSGGQKIEALRTLKKFPAFEEEVDLDAEDDLRKYIVEQIQGAAGCDDLDFADDIEPWVGDRFAVAAVETGADEPAPVFVVQVTDEGAAEKGFEKIKQCAGAGVEESAWTINDGWALLAETQEILDGVADEVADGTLAEDEDYQRWTAEAGDAGIVTIYAAPELGALYDDTIADLGKTLPQGQLGMMSEALEDFKGAAATVRFDDGGLEVEAASDISGVEGIEYGDQAGDLVAGLPEGTVAAVAVSLGGDWTALVMEQMESAAEAAGMSVDEMLTELEVMTGLDLPEDAETLTGDAITVALGPDSNLDEPASSGLGVKIQGDADEIEKVLDKARTAAGGADEGVLDSSVEGDAVAVGPDADWRKALLEDGGLGESDSFRRVVEHTDNAVSVLYVDFDGSDDWLADLFGDDPETRDNVEPLDAFGMSSWIDGETGHVVVKLTTE
jgi:hypothetical protein